MGYKPKIHLSNLHEFSDQQVFDQVAVHLLKQGQRSLRGGDINPTECRYRGHGGMMCAAGCLVSDDEYDPLMESVPWVKLTKDRTAGVPKAHRTLIARLQAIHDTDNPEEWKRKLSREANILGLNTQAIDEL